MERISNILNNTTCNIRAYLLQKQQLNDALTYQGAELPNSVSPDICNTYKDNFDHFIQNREIAEYDAVHIERGTIQRVDCNSVSRWGSILNAIRVIDSRHIFIDSNNMSDSYSLLVLSCSAVFNGINHEAYLLANYKKLDSWYRRGIKIAFLGNALRVASGDILVLNGNIDAAVFENDIFLLNDSAGDKLFDLTSRSRQFLDHHRASIEICSFINDPRMFFRIIYRNKQYAKKLARAIENNPSILQLDANSVKNTLSRYAEFDQLQYDENDKIIITDSNKHMILDIMLNGYSRGLFSDVIIHTKGQ